MFRRIVALPALALLVALAAPQIASAQMGQGWDLYRWAGHWGTPSDYYDGDYYPTPLQLAESGEPYPADATIGANEVAVSYFLAPQQPQFIMPANSALIEMEVPANAEVWFSGTPTDQRGEFRSFVTPALAPGRNYEYTVTARWTAPDGNRVERTQHVPVRAGDRLNVRFQ